MKPKTAVGVSLLLALGVGPQAFGAANADTKRKTQRQQVASKLIGNLLAGQGTARMSVDADEESYLAVTVTNRVGDEMVLEFEPDPADSTLRPILPEGTEPEIFGRAFFGLMTDLMRPKESAGSAKRAQLLPFSAAVAEQPHDDVSVFIVNPDVVLISFWRQGERTGTYFAVNGDGIANESVASPNGTQGDPQSAAGSTSKKSVVCDGLYYVCIHQMGEMSGVVACGVWLYFCADE